METFYTPMRSPTKSRRRALSPVRSGARGGASSFSSSCNVAEVQMNEEQMRAHILEQDNTIRELRNNIKSMEKDMKSKMNESFVIETSTRISANESQTFQNDLVFHEQELRDMKENLRKVKDELCSEKSKRVAAEDDLRRKVINIEELEHRLKSANDSLSRLQEKSRRDLEDAQMQNRTLSLEITTLKAALVDSKEELRRCLHDVRNQKGIIAKGEVDQLPDVQNKIGELTATNKFLEEKITEYKEKEDILSKRLVEVQEDRESAKLELAELQNKLVEVEGNSSLTHKYLLEESNKIKQQKADLRCELLELRRDYNKQKDKLQRLEQNQMNAEEIEKLRSELESCRLREDSFKKMEGRLLDQLHSSEEKVKELEKSLSSMRADVVDLSLEKGINRELREELKKAEAKLIEFSNTMNIVDSQCEQFRELKKRAEISRERAVNECETMATKLREAERELERYRASEVELDQLRAERKRLEMKICYLNEELRETHNDYRSELALLARQISETKHKDLTDNELYKVKIDELKAQITQLDIESRSAKRKLEEFQQEKDALQEQVSAGIARELETTNENKKLRNGLAEALAKIEQYKNEAEYSKEMYEETARQLGINEERMSKLEEEVMNLEEMLREKEKLAAYLQSQIKTRDMPKLSRRSTLLRTPTEISLEIIDPMVVEELENQKTNLLKELEEKKKELMSRKLIPIDASKECEPRTVAAHILARHPLKELQSKSTVDNNDIYDSKRASSLVGTNLCKATMRHDIPHRWTELRHFGLFSIKCAVCFVGVPTFAKKKRCTHCGIIVHSQCASRVVNTCGLPDQCANYYLDSYSAPCGKMNGWIRLFSDDFTVREWLSVWGEMDEKRLLFYDKDPTNFDLRTPFLSVDLEKDLRIVRVGSEVPVKAENGQASHNIVHIRTENRNIYILAPSTQTAKRWAEALQNASTRRMMLAHRSSSSSDQSCLLVLSKPNNLTIHTICVIDSYILIGAQSGLFFTYMSSPRLPVRIGGFNSVSAMQFLQCLNILALVIDHRRLLALIPLSTLKSELNAAQPCLRADVIPGYDNLHVLTHHQQEGQWYLLAANCTKINVLKYNAARDVFIAQQVIKINEPAVCIQSTPRGIYFGSDSFYFVQLGQGELDPVRLADPSIVDYPIALLLIRDDEVLLAYQNYGIFVNSRGERTRSRTVEWEQMPMEFVYTAPYLYVVHYDSIEILRIADYNGLDSDIILDEREVYACHNAHVVYSCSNGDVFISISNTDSVELHRFNATNSKRNPTKRKGLASAGLDKRSKIAV
ncbi:hypothetical protein Angca_006638 [Angiostrongylus cantonensis]|nr:hypothetical protein Angca_006638 [Angiostrongylus cantonensis]